MWHLLLRFRNGACVAIYDLEKAFWQIKYVSSDLGWFATIIQGSEFIFTSMIFGSNFSPAGLEHGLRLILSRAINILRSDPPRDEDEPTRPTSLNLHYYVDDFCYTGTDGATLTAECEWTRWLLAEFGFSSAKFHTNLTNIGDFSSILFSYLNIVI